MTNASLARFRSQLSSNNHSSFNTVPKPSKKETQSQVTIAPNVFLGSVAVHVANRDLVSHQRRPSTLNLRAFVISII